MVHSLKNALSQDVVKLQNYVDHSTNALTKQPVTIDEVGESGAIHSNILKEKPEVNLNKFLDIKFNEVQTKVVLI